MQENKVVEIDKKREVKTYAEMWHTSQCLLAKGIKDHEGCFHQFRASLVFTAFTLEACLNHLGPKVFSCWADLERLSPKQKLNIICEKLDLKTDYGERPWQVMKELFGFRNDIAHGKSEIVTTQEVVPLADHGGKDINDIVRTKWEQYCTRANAERAREDVEQIVKDIYAAGDFKDDHPFMFGFQFSAATVIDR